MKRQLRNVPVEVEFKFLAPDENTLAGIAALDMLEGFRLRRRGLRHLSSVYLDTRHDSLLAHGLALRFRRTEAPGRSGRRAELTVKWSGQADGALHRRHELNQWLPANSRPPTRLPAGPVRDRIAAIVAGRPLRPLLVTEITREVVDVCAGRRQVAELALDRVRLVDPRRRGNRLEYREAEIELRDGRRRELRALATALERRFPLTRSTESKFARGLTLVGARIAAAVPEDAARPSDSAAVAARKVIGMHFRRLRDSDPGVRSGLDPESLHDFRVAMRRLRAALRVFRKVLPGPPVRRVRNDLRWLAGVTGELRDCEVQLALLDRYERRLSSGKRRLPAGFRKALASRAAAHRRRLLATLDSPRYHRLLRRLEDLTRGASDNDLSLERAARRGIAKERARLTRRVRAARAEPSDSNFHRTRIGAKRLRYALEFFRPVLSRRDRRRLELLARIQDALGRDHDAVIAAALARDHPGTPGLTPAKVAALDAYAAHMRRRSAAARRAFARLWEKF